MRRWTDGKSWSASRVSGSFLIYREMEGKRVDKNANRDGMNGNEADSDGGPDGYRYKPDGLMKQSFSMTTNNGQHLHLISYFSRSAAQAQALLQPTQDPQLRHIRPEKGMYPESTVHEQSTIPAVTRGPMSSPGAYTHSPSQPAPYVRAPSYGYPGPGWAPPSPMHTPPPHTQYSPYYHNQAPHAQYTSHSPLHAMHYPPPHGYPPHPGMPNYDRPPPPMSSSGLPPPPPPPGSYAHPTAPPPPHQPYSHAYPYAGAYPYQPPPLQAPPYPPAHHPPYPTRPEEQRAQDPSSATKEDRQDSHVPPSAQPSTSAPSTDDRQAPPGAPAPPPPSVPANSGQTIPSISAMLNGGENGQPPQRTSSRSPNSTAVRQLQDIPSHKIGFEASRDVQALRNLDKSTFKY